MKSKLRVLALAALVVPLALASTPQVSRAAVPVNKVETTLRVSHDCKITITTRWSKLTFGAPYQISNGLFIGDNDWGADTTSLSTHGSFTSTFQATVSTSGPVRIQVSGSVSGPGGATGGTDETSAPCTTPVSPA